jgi:hypothetical protein
MQLSRFGHVIELHMAAAYLICFIYLSSLTWTILVVMEMQHLFLVCRVTQP